MNRLPPEVSGEPETASPDVAPARLTVLSGPTAVGKGTVMAAMRRRAPEVWISVSATTRPARPGEVDGVHYLFLTEERFTELAETGRMLEWAVVHGRHRYGTLREPVEEMLRTGRPVFLELDLQGARQVREAMPDCQLVFLAPPSWEEMVRRLTHRGTETAEERERRLVTAREEMAAAGEFDHVVVNDDVERATDEVLRLMGVDTRGMASDG
ncbi:guanylate kinase [Bogoriella caseilytica]|uniref:Guanylate kinase n=1 Tax=Bogoriella caseilytica TaxID=56055 RepID=A0A3N2B8T5_9MICO|nr:guanylate kinase [Bogoriella caseilytica]ROR71693.1 guanylate kinase [Bogoriella caseilytica]